MNDGKSQPNFIVIHLSKCTNDILTVIGGRKRPAVRIAEGPMAPLAPPPDETDEQVKGYTIPYILLYIIYPFTRSLTDRRD